MIAVAVQGYDPLRDKSYRATGLGTDVAAFLAWMELGGASEAIELVRGLHASGGES